MYTSIITTADTDNNFENPYIHTLFPDLRRELMDEEEPSNNPEAIKSPEIDILINNIPVKGLIDTGSAVNALSEKWYHDHQESLGHHEVLSVNNTTIISAVGNKSKRIRKQVFLEVIINNRFNFDCVFLVVPGLIKNCILGIRFLKQVQGIINIPENKLVFITLSTHVSNNCNTEYVPLMTLGSTQSDIESQIEEKLGEMEDMDQNMKAELKKILYQNQEVFSEKPGLITGYEHYFQVTDKTPYLQKGWPVPIQHQEAVKAEVKRMLEYGIIERSQSPYINPLVTVIKKDGKVRLCLDARRVNSVTVPDYEGPPPINEILARCSGIKIMSTIDLTNSFWQIPLKKECRDYTGFLYEGKCYRFKVTPFGLSTSLASLARGLDHVLTDEVKRNTLIYVDDCLCFSSNIREHFTHLGNLLRNLRKAGMTINLTKSKFFRKEIQYLGYCLTTEGIKATPDKVAAILNFQSPKNTKQLKGFLGLTNFYNKFTDKYAEYTQPLLKLLQKGTKYKWDQQMEEQFRLVKELFINTVVLKFPIPGRRFYLQCDASGYAYGGQLYQLDDNQEISVVAYTSKTFKGAERRYFATERELLAIVQCLKKFRIYILGQPLTIITDNKALTFIQHCHLNNSRITRWILCIQEYNFEILHCRGKENVVADILSRYPEDQIQDNPPEDNYEYQIHSILIKMNKDVAKNLKEISKIQFQNKKLRELIESIKSGEKDKTHQHYKVVEDTLYRKAKGAWKLYIPEEISATLVKEVHQMYGHVGSKKTYNLLKECFTLNNMSKLVAKTIKFCEICQKCKDGGNRNCTAETKPILPTKKNEMVSMDYYGPLPTSTGGVKYLLVIVDNFTKYVELYTLRRATTNATLRRLQQYSQEHGKPQSVLTDNGTQFTTKKWVMGLHQLQIKAKFTAIRNPCTNIAERWNRQLGNLFRLFVHKKHTKWATYVKVIQAVLNETYQETIEMTPYEAQYGRKPTHAWEKYIDLKEITSEEVDITQVQWRIKEKGEKQAARINKLNKSTSFEVGDKVLVRALNISNATQHVIAKFCELYEGP